MSTKTIAIIGLGYVGLPLAVEFSYNFPVTGFDQDQERIDDLQLCLDKTGQIKENTLRDVLRNNLRLSTDPAAIKDCTIYIITVPTPVDQFKRPDLRSLFQATRTVAAVLKKGDLVIYESTVYPGCTEEDCVPLLEQLSGLTYNKDFFCGYSPERINVGDDRNILTSIVKITSGSTPETADHVDRLYASIIKAGTYKAPSIKVAEAAKAIENAQRDLNISFVNELALIFDRMGIDTHDVLEAAGTKWNFLKFKPGLVGGHCIGVDPYYLTYKAETLGYLPQVISSGRRVNEEMGGFIAGKIAGLLQRKRKGVEGAAILILGITFKENCPDTRNSGVISLYSHLKAAGSRPEVFDPWADPGKVSTEYSVTLLAEIDYIKKYDVVILAVSHSVFADIDFARFKSMGAIIYDIKGTVSRDLTDARL